MPTTFVRAQVTLTVSQKLLGFSRGQFLGYASLKTTFIRAVCSVLVVPCDGVVVTSITDLSLENHRSLYYPPSSFSSSSITEHLQDVTGNCIVTFTVTFVDQVGVSIPGAAKAELLKSSASSGQLKSAMVAIANSTSSSDSRAVLAALNSMVLDKEISISVQAATFLPKSTSAPSPIPTQQPTASPSEVHFPTNTAVGIAVGVVLFVVFLVSGAYFWRYQSLAHKRKEAHKVMQVGARLAGKSVSRFSKVRRGSDPLRTFGFADIYTAPLDSFRGENDETKSEEKSMNENKSRGDRRVLRNSFVQGSSKVPMIPPLTSAWTQNYSNKYGRTFWRNSASGEVTWDRPADLNFTLLGSEDSRRLAKMLQPARMQVDKVDALRSPGTDPEPAAITRSVIKASPFPTASDTSSHATPVPRRLSPLFAREKPKTTPSLQERRSGQALKVIKPGIIKLSEVNSNLLEPGHNYQNLYGQVMQRRAEVHAAAPSRELHSAGTLFRRTEHSSLTQSAVKQSSQTSQRLPGSIPGPAGARRSKAIRLATLSTDLASDQTSDRLHKSSLSRPKQ